MPVMTVTGQIEPDSLGITLAHEHLFIDIRNQFREFEDPRKARISKQKLRTSNLDAVRRNPYAIRDNLLLDDVDLIVEEAGAFKKLGGTTIVDCTSVGIHRDPVKLREVARRTGLNVIAGCGYYTHDTHPAEMGEWTPEQIAEHMVRDLTVGIAGTGIKAGVIGEIGTSHPVTPEEKKVLAASAIASCRTGAPIQVHTYPWAQEGRAIATRLLEAGVAPHKIVICHTDVEPVREYIEALLALGVFVEFDNIGKEFDIPEKQRAFAGGRFVSDPQRVHLIRDLLEQGHGARILISNDICLKCLLLAYGGEGYNHLLRNIVPMMRAQGIDEEAIRGFLIDNPARLFADGDAGPPRS